MQIIDVMIEIALAVISLIMFASAIFCGYKHAKAKAAKDESDAAWYGAVERICANLFLAFFIAFLVVEHMGLMTTGLIKIITILEGLTANG